MPAQDPAYRAAEEPGAAGPAPSEIHPEDKIPAPALIRIAQLEARAMDLQSELNRVTTTRCTDCEKAKAEAQVFQQLSRKWIDQADRIHREALDFRDALFFLKKYPFSPKRRRRAEELLHGKA